MYETESLATAIIRKFPMPTLELFGLPIKLFKRGGNENLA